MSASSSSFHRTLAPLQIGSWQIDPALILAPMAGVSDLPFRRLCRSYGAGLTVAEMIHANPELWDSSKSQLRREAATEAAPRSVQILGADPAQMALCAARCEQEGADILDINMGCPAKKVCKVAAGSALLRDEKRVEQILRAVVAAVSIPVTLKIRTGWDREQRNAPVIADIAENCGIQMITVHGRTRADAFLGQAEYETIALIKQQRRIPIIANGDITSAAKAAFVRDLTGCDGLMIGRAARGRPWIFNEIRYFFMHRDEHLPAAPDAVHLQELIQRHLQELYDFYGEKKGVQIARKHLRSYLETAHVPIPLPLLQAQSAVQQLMLLEQVFHEEHTRKQL